MSGIAGVLMLDGAPPPRDVLSAMAERLEPRAPDGVRTWVGGAGLAHGLLLTGDETHPPPQPFSPDGDLWIVADARIDGREELVRDLAAAGIRASAGDAAVALIAHAWRAWGEECATHLLGDFAFAIWNAADRTLFCARDHFGVKPFFHAQAGGAFVFASSLECVRAHSAVSSTLDEAWIGDFLVHGDTQDPTATVYAAIRQLAPAHTLTVRHGQARTRRYWRLPADEPLRYRRVGDYVEHFRGVLRQAVGDRLPQGPASFFLSGGRDSNSLAATARDIVRAGERRTDLRAFSAYHARLMPDREREYTEMGARALGIPTEFLAVDDYPAFGRWEAPDMRRPEPTASALMAIEVDQMKAAAAHGRVLFTGQGGDAVFRESRSRLTKLAAEGRLLQAAREAAEYAWWHRRLPRPGVRTWMRTRRGARAWYAEAPGWIREDFARRTGLHERVAAANAHPPPAHPLRPEAYEQLEAPLWPGLFLAYDPGVTGIPLEVRHPYFDPRLVRLLLSIPPAQWYNDKGLLRMGMRGSLPEALLRRPKTPLVDDPLRVRMAERGEGWLGGRTVSENVAPWIDLDRVPRATGGRSPAPPEGMWNDVRPLALSLWLARHRT